MEPLFEMFFFFFFKLLVSKSQLIEISLLKYLSSEYYAVKFLLINWLSIIQVGKVLIFFLKRKSVYHLHIIFAE